MTVLQMKITLLDYFLICICCMGPRLRQRGSDNLRKELFQFCGQEPSVPAAGSKLFPTVFLSLSLCHPLKSMFGDHVWLLMPPLVPLKLFPALWSVAVPF